MVIASTESSFDVNFYEMNSKRQKMQLPGKLWEKKFPVTTQKTYFKAARGFFQILSSTCSAKIIEI